MFRSVATGKCKSLGKLSPTSSPKVLEDDSRLLDIITMSLTSAVCGGQFDGSRNITRTSFYPAEAARKPLHLFLWLCQPPSPPFSTDKLWSSETTCTGMMNRHLINCSWDLWTAAVAPGIGKDRPWNNGIVGTDCLDSVSASFIRGINWPLVF